MKFEENLRELRKQYGLSQEELADRLQVSRQSVSKWENGSASPELEKLMQLCELFHCTLDDLLKGEVKEKPGLQKEEYESANKIERWLICIGICAIMIGVSLYCFLEPSFENEREVYLNAFFMVFVLIGVVCFVSMGLRSSAFHRNHPTIPLGLYQEEELQRFEQRFHIGIIVGIALMILSVIVQQLCETSIGSAKANGIFILIAMVAVLLFVSFGMQKAKFEATQPQVAKSKQEEKADRYCQITMILATGIYLIWSFLGHAWYISWIVFVIGGLACGIIHIIMRRA